MQSLPNSCSLQLNGVFLLDKPQGISSHQALVKVKKIYHVKKAGHTGTLDPLATGLLPICLGESTKFSGYLLNADKVYEATLQLGITTTTGDAEGQVLTHEENIHIHLSQIKETLANFIGIQSQIPPMYSALKHQGQPLYQLARRGITLPRQPRTITIHEIELLCYVSPYLKLSIHCSKGTYIRVLAEDIGKVLGCGATLSSLRRTAIGSINIRDAHTLDTLSQVEKADSFLLSHDVLLKDFPSLTLDITSALQLLQGKTIELSEESLKEKNDTLYRIYHGQFLGLVIKKEHSLTPVRMMSIAHLSS